LKNIVKITACTAFTLLLVACSTKKDSFISRKYHSISTEYNVLYNGQLALEDGLNALNTNYEDNYWEVLPIEPLKVDELAMPGMRGDVDKSPQEFERAEEKAVKAIQKHSMLIGSQEKNSEIDAAYLLLGKSRYYSKRFVPAIEAFNYIIINYREANLIDITRIWQAKTNIRLQNEEMAIETLKLLLKKESLSDKNREAANTAMAMAYSKTDSIEKEIKHLNLAVLTHHNKEQTARNLFILGQLYRGENKIDSSNIAFQNIIDLKKAPYKYKIHAHIELAKNVSNKEEAIVRTEELKHLIKDRYNRAYLDKLYYRLGDITLAYDNEADALKYYKLSIQSSNANNLQKELSYEAVGNLHFDKAEFITAGAYFDSVLNISKDENSKRIRSLKRKRNNLDEVILYEDIAHKNDSILNIIAMSNDERLTYFNNHIDQLKAEEKRLKELEEAQNINLGAANLGLNYNNASVGGKWYFYNTQVAGFGQQGFKNIWGNRILEDNWRLSEKAALNMNNPNQTIITKTETNTNQKYDLKYYLDKIPSNQTKIDSISHQRNEAYYYLGITYEAKFKETTLAISRLEKLLTFNPSEEFSLPAKYQLYKMYTALDNNSKALVYKNDITTNYPDSRYTTIILHPSEITSETTISEAETAYAAVYYEFKDEKYESVIEKSTAAIAKFEGKPIVPKFELLKAYAIGKKDGILAFKESLIFIIANYPSTEEGKKANEVLTTLNTKI